MSIKIMSEVRPRPVVPAPDVLAPDVLEILRAVAARRGLSVDAIRGHSRVRDVTYARHLSWWLLVRHYQVLHVVEAARLFGFDHASVSAGIRRISMELRWREGTRADIAAVLLYGDKEGKGMDTGERA